MIIFSGSKKDAGDKKLRREKSRYQFEDMFNDRFSPDMPDEKWISGKKIRF